MRRAIVASALAALSVACGAKGPTVTGQTGRRDLAAPRVVPGDLDAKALLTNVPSRASALGASPVSLVAAGEAFEGERMGAFVDVPADACLLSYARASGSIEDLDVAIFSDEGTPLAVDEAPDAHPTVVLCPPHPDRVYVAAHVANGEGLVAVAAQLVPRDRATRVAHDLGARGAVAGGPRPTDNWPGLEESVRAHRTALGGRWEEFRKIVVSVDARAGAYVPLPIEADQCTDVVIVPGEEVALLDVEAFDADGRVVARAKEGGRVRSLTVCSALAVGGSIAIRPHVGRGLVAVVLARGRAEVARDLTARADVAWASPAQSLGSAKSARSAELAKHGYDARETTLEGTLTLGRRNSVPLDLRGALGGGSPCARVDVVAGAPLALVEASAWDDAGGLVGSAEGGASVTLFVCTHKEARLDLETRGRPGPYAVLVRAETWKDPSFATSPLAAARMLARAADGPAKTFEGAPIGARAIATDPARMTSWTRTVPAGKCLRVAAGAQGDGSGLDLRIFDGATSDEIDRSHASTAVSARACAEPNASRNVRVELTSTSGKLDVVIGERD